MIRRQFIGWVVGVMGLGQQVKTDEATCFVFDGHDLKEGPCRPACKPGEERCPLGHCQKPLYLDVLDIDGGQVMHPIRIVNIFGTANGKKSWSTWNIKPHVCSVCGIIYTSVKDAH